MAISKLPPAKVVRAIETARYRIGQLHRRMLPAPAVMMEMLTYGWSAQAIAAAADLGIADALAKGPLTAQELAAAIDADADAVSRLLRALIPQGIFRQRRDGRYDLTPLADTLRTDAEVSLAAMAQFTGLPEHLEMLEPPRGCHPDRRGCSAQATRQNRGSSCLPTNRNSPKSSIEP